MKIRTNLDSKELQKIAKGLDSLAAQKCSDEAPALANGAEYSLVQEVVSSLDSMINSLQEDLSSIFSGA